VSGEQWRLGPKRWMGLGGYRVDVREGGPKGGSRFVCEATLDDAERIVAAVNQAALVERYRAALEWYVCDWCSNRVGFHPDLKTSPYPPPCRKGGCAKLRAALHGEQADGETT
jgi:hypothetical protein